MTNQPPEHTPLDEQEHHQIVDTRFTEAYRIIDAVVQIIDPVDQPLAQQIVAAWEHMLAANEAHNRRIVTLMNLVQAATSQRDEAVTKLEHLEIDLDDPHSHDVHPKVAKLVQRMVEEADERAEDLKEAYIEAYADELNLEAEEYAAESIRDAVAEGFADVLGINTYEAHDVLEILEGSSHFTELTAEERQAFKTLLTSAIQRSRTERNSRRKWFDEFYEQATAKRNSNAAS